jgi:5-methylthioadenosine/S-adenosylhomocysteine deaminase
VLFDMDQPHLCPRHNLGANLVHSAGAGDVTHVIVDGRVLYANGEFLTLDVEKIQAEAQARAKALAGRLPPTFPGKGRIRIPFGLPPAQSSVEG